MEENATTVLEAGDPPLVDEIRPVDALIKPQIVEPIKIKQENGDVPTNDLSSKDESGIVMECVENGKDVALEAKGVFAENEVTEVNDDARSLGDLDSLPVGDEITLGAAGSDSGVEGCGRALSSGGGSRSCASSVVSCGSGCGSESSSLAGAPPRPRRKVSVTVAEPKRGSPVGSSTPRPVTAPRGPNLATRERARSREKPAIPEKPRPLTPKPRIRPSTDLPNLVRESPALRAKPTKTSTARCRTPNSPSEEKRWPSNGPRLPTVSDASATRVAADKYGTLPRRRREPEQEGSPKHDSSMPPPVRRPTVTRSMSSRAPTKTRVRIYAEKVSQTVLIGTDIENALAGLVPNIESRVSVSMCHRGVQASSRDAELSRLMAAAAAASAAAAEERAHRLQADKQLEEERAARQAAVAQLEANSQRLLELAGAGADANAEGCLRALEEQLRAASELAAKQRAEIDSLRAHADNMQKEAYSSRAESRALSMRLEEAERDAAEMQDFLAAETGALSDSLREAEADVLRLSEELERRRVECRQLVRMCEQRRQEALCAAARARAAAGGGAGAGAHRALHALSLRLHALTRAVRRAYAMPHDVDADAVSVYHNMAFSRSDSGEQLSQEEPRGLVAAIARALRFGPQQPTVPSVPSTPNAAPTVGTPHSVPYVPEDERSRVSDDNDNSADLLDSETEPCLVTDPDCAEEWWSGAEGAGAWSGEELSPERESYGDIDKEASYGSSGSERESLRNLSAAITQRQRSEAEDADRGTLLDRVVSVDERLTELLRVLRHAAALNAHDADSTRLANALRDKLEVTEKNVTDVVVKKLAELDASKNMMNHYHNSVEALKKQQSQSVEEDELQKIEEELSSCGEEERRSLYLALDAASGALAGARGARRRPWPRLDSLALALERLAFALAAPTHTHPHPHPHPHPPHTPARMHVQSTA